MQRKRLIYAGILILAGLLRIIALAGRGIEYDDAFSFFLARQPLPAIIAGTAADTMPPLYYFLLHCWLSLGQAVWVLRLLNVILSLGIVALLYDLTSRWFGPAAAGWAALLAAVSPFQIFYAQGMRMYVLLGLTQLGYVWCFFQLLIAGEKSQVKRRLAWIGLVVCGTAAMYSHNLAVFSLIAPNVYLVLTRRWRLLARLIGAQLLIGLGTAPWLVLVPGQIAKVQGAFWTPRPGGLEIIQALVMFHANLPVPPDWLPAAVLASLLFFTLVVYELIRNRPHATGFAGLLAFAVVPPGLLFATSYLMRPVFVPRAFILSSLAYYACAGYAISRTRLRLAGIVTGLVFVIPALACLPYQYAFAEFPRSPFQAAVNWLAQVNQPGDVIVHDNKLSFFPAYFYEAGLQQVFLPDLPQSPNDTFAPASQKAMEIYPAHNLPTAVAGSARVWFVVFDKAIAEYQQVGIDEHPAIAWLRNHYRSKQETHFNDLSIYEFTR